MVLSSSLNSAIQVFGQRKWHYNPTSRSRVNSKPVQNRLSHTSCAIPGVNPDKLTLQAECGYLPPVEVGGWLG